MQFRLIAADLDNTLLDENSVISERNRVAIKQAVDLGIRFIIVTGRMFRTSVAYLDDLDLEGDCPIINFHGALVKTSRSEKVILHRPLDNSLAVAVTEEAKRLGCHVSLFIGDRLYIEEENEYSRYYRNLANIDLQPVGSLAAFLKSKKANPSKLSIIRWDGLIDQVEAGLKTLFAEELSILQSRPYFLEITAGEATKGQTLSWLAERENIKREEIIAFGDGLNDLDMVNYAGLGVAVANAHPEVLEAADLVTASNQEDGVAEVIEAYLLGWKTG